MTTTNTTNFATNLRWVCNIPVSVLFPDEADVNFNLTSFNIPEIEIQGIDVSYKGYSVEVPNGLIQPGTKDITFDYIVDANMRIYYLLYEWANMYTGKVLKTVKDDDAFSKKMPLQGADRVPIFVTVLDEYKKAIMKIKYHNCWIKGFTSLTLNYQDDPSPLTHSFTFAYERFEIERLTPTGYHYMPDGTLMQGDSHTTSTETSQSTTTDTDTSTSSQASQSSSSSSGGSSSGGYSGY
jgi:hypothetical protein